ncbi:MAG: xanthine dehydrogenase family protein subunit M [Alphaproteobacteria bacterium]|nr:xanthine dehydrogenase family protein subunit M [Alphaproteobacteria bacterium]MBU0804014.1 xanthine dehydrogenase family protein subunit M [Alphaproteobacteria bacterium]MBU0872689.1 xanthine dehydrogenase family protein subunit M [Alphaproteobacteria bacterium]MBU1402941.1 xanthine dehydrogenase family protein subunit M [Alphaproteobacteria bacterium]MBU1593583.1 xanthine dehydrogenase family protein subunit M [Alphaproteobacteria bacterium]
MSRYAKPTSLDEALTLLGDASWRMLAGGTDFYPAQGTRPLTGNILDLNGLDALRGIADTASHVVIGARTTWTELLRHPLPPAFDALKQAAREVGSVQIQNMASIAGNLCNASPAADGVPPLIVLDAEVELRSIRGSRVLPLGDFILGNRKTALLSNELVTAIRVPKNSTHGTSAFVKLGARRYLVISIAMAAARIELAGDGSIASAAIAVGSCSAVAQRLAGLEAALVGQKPGPDIERAVAEADLAALTPIDDVRGTAEYRRAAAREIVLRALAQASAPSGQSVAA